ncbi:MAG: sugar ABC transporter substrate-binding protein [Candidatus Eisenbacteria bacterium]|nr:sugar ABC transporter substrate-binding protein [Candidatus Eisenbacteria bacterium]
MTRDGDRRRAPGRFTARTLFRFLLFLSFAAALGVSCRDSGDARRTLRFWAMGREGEVVQELMSGFEGENPGLHVEVQQIPWSAAHEKLLTAHVGRSTPDVAQIGNTWIAEFVALRALERLDERAARSAGVPEESFFPGIWDTNIIDGALYGIPWYVDTRVLFYRKDILARTGRDAVPETWEEWREAMMEIKASADPDHYAVFLPTNEPTQAVIFGLQAGSTLLAENGTRGAFSGPAFRRAFRFYIDLFRDGLAPPVSNTEVSNLYREFARGYFAMYITGPWNLGEFRNRLPEELQDEWAVAPLPGPGSADAGVSLAGGSSLVLFRESREKEDAWRLVEFLSRPENQLRFYHLTGDLPARVEAWRDSALAGDPRINAFETQLRRVVSTPKVPEWEQIATRVMMRAEEAIRGSAPPDSALAALDRDVDRILEKRRWMIERERETAASPEEGS